MFYTCTVQERRLMDSVSHVVSTVVEDSEPITKLYVALFFLFFYFSMIETSFTPVYWTVVCCILVV